MVPFAGWRMPLQYPDRGTLDAHKWVRAHAGLFDVSHMLQLEVTGRSSADFLSRLTTCNVRGLAAGAAVYTLFTTPSGGIVDDLILTARVPASMARGGDASARYQIVSNAARAAHDLAHLDAQLAEFSHKEDVNVRVREDRALIAVQGPTAAAVLQPLVHAPSSPIALSQLPFMHGVENVTVAGVQGCDVTRCGYTGEDGFEISIPAAHATRVVDALMECESEVAAIGLGARDTLRLEAGLCLYGHDLDEDTSPVEAGLAWAVAKSRRETGEFLGDGVILEQLRNPKAVARKRIGLIVNGAPARGRHISGLFTHLMHAALEGAEVLHKSPDDELVPVGRVTSGGPSPSLGQNIAMAYVATGNAKLGTELAVQVRGKVWPATVVKMPFVPNRYYKPE